MVARSLFPPAFAQATIPPWASAVAAGHSVLGAIDLPGHLLLLPIEDALPVSVDALFLGPDDLPRSHSDLAKLLHTLRPGGVGALAIPRGSFAKRELETFLLASGLRYHSSAATHSNVARLVLVENPGGLTERPTLRFSFVLVGPFTESAALRRRIAAWSSFLSTEFRAGGTELVAVRDGPVDEPVGSFQGEFEYAEVQHYKSFGEATSILSGLRFARGRRVLVDASAGAVAPGAFLDLLLPMLEPAEHRPDVVTPVSTSGSDSAFPRIPPVQGGSLFFPTLRRLRNAGRRLLLGASEPVADFFLMDHAVARTMQPGPRERVRFSRAALLLPPVRGRALREVPLGRVGPGPVQPGLVRSLYLRFKR